MFIFMSSFNHSFIFYTPDVLLQIIINFAYVCALFSVEDISFISFVALCDRSLPAILAPTVPPPISPGFSIAGIFSRH